MKIPMLVTTLLFAANTFAQSQSMPGMQMPDDPKPQATAQQSHTPKPKISPKHQDPSMQGMDMSAKPAASVQKTHDAKGSIKKINAKTGYVMISHGPVNSLSWPPMTMSFKVKDKAMLKQLSVGKKIDFGFVQEGDDYVVTTLR